MVLAIVEVRRRGREIAPEGIVEVSLMVVQLLLAGISGKPPKLIKEKSLRF